MPVRNPNLRQRPHTFNQEPSTARGRRRSAGTQEYQQNFAERKMQTAGVRRRGKGSIGRGPFKGPNNRPAGTSQKDWRDYMSGFKTNL